MASRKPIVTRTFAPIHFEDLDPHRFEDLVRELIYDFRDWQSIEATGRAGGDEGFDIRAFEKVTPIGSVDQPSSADQDDDDDAVRPHPMDGPRWMIQVKREKALSPSDVKKILRDVSEDDPPYGYILAASVVFSKRSYDVFREELRNKGVMEFYLWGRPELEDMLHQPKNDRILFTFFGISLVSRRRSRTTEVRSVITIKNRLFKILGGPAGRIDRNVLLRDVQDDHYPYKDGYGDFDARPRWVERIVARHHPKGLILHRLRYFAFVDRKRKEWDYTDHVDLMTFHRDVLSDEERIEHGERQDEVESIWSFLPRAKQGEYAVDVLCPYSRILAVDPEGDGYHTKPHLYLDMSERVETFDRLTVTGEEIELDDTWHRIGFFPTKFSKPTTSRRVHRQKRVMLDPETVNGFSKLRDPVKTLFALDDRYDFLEQRDVLIIADTVRKDGDSELMLEVRYVAKLTFAEYLVDFWDKHRLRMAAKRQIGRDVMDDERVTVVEVEQTYPRHGDV